MGIESAIQTNNRLLCGLSSVSAQRLLPYLRLSHLRNTHVLYEPQGYIDRIYFPVSCVLSSVMIMDDGASIEVGMVGNEGAAGLAAFQAVAKSRHRTFVQFGGQCWSIDASILRDFSREDAALKDSLIGYHQAFLSQLSQLVACNGLHRLLKRCCRWLLMTSDRVGEPKFLLTHDFISYMLGVRRAGVTECLGVLQAQGLVSVRRGSVEIIDRFGLEAAACECYRAIVEEYRQLSHSGPAAMD